LHLGQGRPARGCGHEVETAITSDVPAAPYRHDQVRSWHWDKRSWEKTTNEGQCSTGRVRGSADWYYMVKLNPEYNKMRSFETE